MTTVPERVTEPKIFTCGLCTEPFTLNPADNHYTAAEWADGGYFGMPSEPTERRSA